MTRPNKPNRRHETVVTARVDRDTHRALKRQARNQDRTLSAVIRQALAVYLDSIAAEGAA